MTTDERLQKVEGQLARVRWFNRCLIACIVLSLGVWFILKAFAPETAWAQSGTKEIRANKFVLEDEKGKVRATLAMTGTGPILWLSDENGKQRATLGAFEVGPVLFLNDETGTTRVSLAAFKEGPALALGSKNGGAAATLNVRENRPSLALYDVNGESIWSAP